MSGSSPVPHSGENSAHGAAGELKASQSGTAERSPCCKVKFETSSM